MSLSLAELHPETAKLVGATVASYAALEEAALFAYAMIAPTDPMTSFREFYRLRSLHLREEMVLKAAAQLDPYRYRAFRRVWRRLKGAANRRTEIAHVLFASDGDAAYRRRIEGERIWFEELTPELFNRTRDQFRTLHRDLLMLAVECSGGPERGVEIIEQLPRPPGVAPQVGPLPPPELTPSVESEIAAAREALGLHEIPPRPDYLATSLQTDFRLSGPPKTSGE